MENHIGEDTYENMLDMLSKGKFFNPLLKDELLSVMDRLRQECGNMKEFRDRLEKEGYYMRLVSDKGKSHYVYGIPDRGFYLKDTALPESVPVWETFVRRKTNDRRRAKALSV